MKSKKYICLIALCIGATTILINIAMDIWFPSISESFGELRWVFVGVGAGLAGAGFSAIISKRMYKENPELARQARINENDERYVQVRKTAAYYMWFITTLVLAVMSLIFMVLKLWVPVWIALLALLIHIGLYVSLLFKINKDM